MNVFKYSIVIPVFNEQDSLKTLVEEINSVSITENIKFKIIFVDDGSTDNSLLNLKSLKNDYKNSNNIKITIIQFASNFGKANALQAGFDTADTEYIFTMDADLQDDPKEIPNFISYMNEHNLDMVSGWKFKRLDSKSKTIPSKIANGVMRSISGVKIHDMNCGFKLYKNHAAKYLDLYGDRHRFIPALLARKFKIGEVKVNHRKREFGKSKYGTMRIFTSFYDFLGILLQTKFLEKPLHFFGTIGVVTIFLSFISLLYLAFLWITQENPIGTRPLFTFSVVMFSLGIQVIMTGLIAELVIKRTTKKEYIINQLLD